MEYVIVVQDGTGRQVSSQAETCPFERKKKQGLGSLTTCQVYSYDWKNSPLHSSGSPGLIKSLTRRRCRGTENPSLTPEPILSPLIGRTFTIGPLLPRMGPQCARFIPKGLGLCDPHSSLTYSPSTRRQIPYFLGSVAVWAWDRGRVARNHWAPRDPQS